MLKSIKGTSLIFIDENIPLLSDIFGQFFSVHNFNGRLLTNAELVSNKCTALICRSTTNINETLLKNTEVRFVGTATSGIDHIDTDYLRQSGIHFAYAPGSNANSVAEYVIYSILLWAKPNGFDIKGKTLGVVGFGNIGSIVAKYGHYLGLKILVNDPLLKETNFSFPDYTSYAELDEICSQSDVLTNHVPLVSDGMHPTYNLFSAEQINLIPQNALIILASRGEVVIETALIKRLKTNSICAVTDVWENEPQINPVLAKLSLLISPHTAGYSFDGKMRGVLQMATSYENFANVKLDLSSIQNELKSYSPLQPEKFSDYSFLFEQLSISRHFKDDHSNLINTLELPNGERTKAFDRLRKTYPKRREIL
ncbi:MAG: 4-phosphoerythronate dehydrogenase [Bacteroidota bacterium]